jgi:hypothetical protein
MYIGMLGNYWGKYYIMVWDIMIGVDPHLWTNQSFMIFYHISQIVMPEKKQYRKKYVHTTYIATSTKYRKHSLHNAFKLTHTHTT